MRSESISTKQPVRGPLSSEGLKDVLYILNKVRMRLSEKKFYGDAMV